MTKEEKTRQELTDKALEIEGILDELVKILLKENNPKDSTGWTLESEHASSLLATLEDTQSQVETLKRRI